MRCDLISFFTRGGMEGVINGEEARWGGKLSISVQSRNRTSHSIDTYVFLLLVMGCERGQSLYVG